MIYDISVPIRNRMPVWPSDPPVSLERQSHLSRDGSHTVRLTSMRMGSHTGTHMDAPFHFIEGGKTLDQMPIDVFWGPATVVDVRRAKSITLDHVQARNWKGVERVLFQTDNSEHWDDGHFFEGFVYLEADAAQFLAEHSLKLVGIDYLSIDPYGSVKHPAHFALLGRGVVLLEGLNLSGVRPGNYILAALPLRIEDADGAPARAFLMDVNQAGI